MIKNYFLTFLFAFAYLNAGYSQEVESVSHTNSWFMYFGNHRLSDKLSLHTEYQWRRSEVVGSWQQSLARVGLDYRTGKNAMITAGYAYIISYPYGKQPILFEADEHRIWQQLILTQRAGIFHFQHRYRLEQRFLEKLTPEGHNDGRTYANRFRYRGFVSIPLNRKRMEPDTWFLGLYEELFLGFGNNVSSKNILDQNRLYAALGYQFSKAGNLQAGYLFHRVFKPDGIRRENNHTLQLGIIYNFDWRT